MENVYLVLVGVLFLLAISDLIVGVSNDAVNFLNAAVGSKVASFKVIVFVAALGVLVGAVSSSGMMEVARKGIFHPQMFYFSEIMLIFLAVMTTDILMLDTFNTLGLPTSTTVSIVFELLGAAVGMATIKLSASPEALLQFKQFLFKNHLIDNLQQSLNLGDFINSSKALEIIAGILFSVAVAFIVGALIQYIARIVFSFRYQNRMKWFGGLWGGIAFTAITYFIVIKGAHSASFMTNEVKTWIVQNTSMILWMSLLFWTLFLQLLNWIFKVNILKTIVLVGTFSLALAFAGNDLVNFIGVPIAGYNAYHLFMQNPGADPNTVSMIGMAGKVATPMVFLFLAGLVMMLTLALSKKAKNVIKTSVDLSRQDEGDERFKANAISKAMVRSSIGFSKVFDQMVPAPIRQFVNRQFEQDQESKRDADAPAFDLIRASVTLVVASLLIALGTSMTLPLSTTYVTFMVAMGTSLADKAWDRESAVYRISGVFSVIGGWFITAFSAFTMAFIVVYLFYYGGMPGIFLILALLAFLVIRSYRLDKRKSRTVDEENKAVYQINDDNLLEQSNATLVSNLKKIVREYRHTIEGLELEKRKKLKQSNTVLRDIAERTKYLKDHVNVIIDRLEEQSVDSAYLMVQVLDYMREMVHSITFFNQSAFDHVDNNHKPLLEEQIAELKQLAAHLDKQLKLIMQSILSVDYANQDNLLEMQAKALDFLESCRKNQIRRIKKGQVGTRNSMLYLNLLTETKNLFLQSVNLFKSQRDFSNFKRKK
jgi:phosphate/sulfate permease